MEADSFLSNLRWFFTIWIFIKTNMFFQIKLSKKWKELRMLEFKFFCLRVSLRDATEIVVLFMDIRCDYMLYLNKLLIRYIEENGNDVILFVIEENLQRDHFESYWRRKTVRKPKTFTLRLVATAQLLYNVIVTAKKPHAPITSSHFT